MSKVIVVGAGASGVIAALKASEKHEVIILEKNDKILKKLLLTGNGHCNYWHDNISFSDYYTDDVNLLKEILQSKDETLAFLSHLGLYPRIKDGYYYPYSNQAYSVKEIFERALAKKNIKIIYNVSVNKIIKENGKFIINDMYDADKVIIAAGSKACPKTGSDGSSFMLAESFNHTISNVFPSLVQLKSEGWFLKVWSGIRCDAKVTLYINDEKVKEEEGEVQLTDYGISGICVFNLSGTAARMIDQDVHLKINFLPFLKEDAISFLEKRDKEVINSSIYELLESLFSYKLSDIIIKQAGISKNAHLTSLTINEKERLNQLLTNFDLHIIGTNDFDKAQVCTGGISLKEINASMQSKLVNDLFFIGEELNVDGPCGGYNLAFAFISGFIAGNSI